MSVSSTPHLDTQSPHAHICSRKLGIILQFLVTREYQEKAALLQSN